MEIQENSIENLLRVRRNNSYLSGPVGQEVRCTLTVKSLRGANDDGYEVHRANRTGPYPGQRFETRTRRPPQPIPGACLPKVGALSEASTGGACRRDAADEPPGTGLRRVSGQPSTSGPDQLAMHSLKNQCLPPSGERLPERLFRNLFLIRSDQMWVHTVRLK